MILSFDIGLKNMAYCIISADSTLHSHEIVEWSLVTLESTTIYTLADSIISTCERLFSGKCFTDILIENQPCMKAPTMKSIQMIIFTYMRIHFKDANIYMCSAANKLKVSKNKIGGKLTYTEKKKRAVEVTKEYIQGAPFEQFFSSCKKRDDLADAYLQAVYYIENKYGGAFQHT
jgi:hypothetical protein